MITDVLIVNTKQKTYRPSKDNTKKFVTEEDAINIGRKFLEQYNSGVTFENIVSDKGSWLVTFAIGFKSEKRTMRISSTSGVILNLTPVT